MSGPEYPHAPCSIIDLVDDSAISNPDPPVIVRDCKFPTPWKSYCRPKRGCGRRGQACWASLASYQSFGSVRAKLYIAPPSPFAESLRVASSANGGAGWLPHRFPSMCGGHIPRKQVRDVPRMAQQIPGDGRCLLRTGAQPARRRGPLEGQVVDAAWPRLLGQRV
jgi:hypothetical protein